MMNDKLRMGRKRLDSDEKRDKSVVAYLTAGEEQALSTIGADMGGTSNALRQGFAMLIKVKRPDLATKLRSDLTGD